MFISSVILHFFLVFLIVFLAILQSSSSDGIASFSSSYNSVFDSKSAVDFLSKLTWVVSIIFVLNIIFLSMCYNDKKISILKKIENPKVTTTHEKFEAPTGE